MTDSTRDYFAEQEARGRAYNALPAIQFEMPPGPGEVGYVPWHDVPGLATWENPRLGYQYTLKRHPDRDEYVLIMSVPGFWVDFLSDVESEDAGRDVLSQLEAGTARVVWPPEAVDAS